MRIGALITVAAAALAAPTGGAAAVVCENTADTKTLEVRLTGSFDLAAVSLSGSTIVVSDAAVPVTCAGDPPTLTGVDTVVVGAAPGLQSTFVVIENAGAFTPGATPEDGDDEIEFTIDLGDAPNSAVSVRSAIPASFRFGADGVNTNATAFEEVPDVDVTLVAAPDLEARGLAQGVTFDARGGAGTGGPPARALTLVGGSGADTLRGTPFDDRLEGGGGADLLDGGAGDDSLDPGPGDDTVAGGPGRDVVDYATPFHPVGLTLDLRVAGPQPTGASGRDALEGVEDVLGTENVDLVTGDAGPNLIETFNGGDVVDGGAGPDELRTGGGPDVVRVRDGERDVVDCDVGADTVTADAPGVDALSACETVAFPPGPGDPPAAPAGGAPAPAPPVVAATPRAPVLSGLRISPRALSSPGSGPRARGGGVGARVRFRLDRAAAVTFRVARRVAGRRIGGRCVPVRVGTRPPPRCTRLVTLRGAFTRTGAAGANAVRFAGRVGGRPLPSGPYTLVATPRADDLTGRTARIPFTVR